MTPDHPPGHGLPTANATVPGAGRKPLTVDGIQEARRQLDSIGAGRRLKIIVSDLCVKDGQPYDVPRTWRQRLFTRPWRPLQKTTTVVPKVPIQGGIRVGDIILVHPETAAKLQP